MAAASSTPAFNKLPDLGFSLSLSLSALMDRRPPARHFIAAIKGLFMPIHRAAAEQNQRCIALPSTPRAALLGALT